jgi:tRNA nucleotidyltransferase (CCA-adding enzyme)
MSEEIKSEVKLYKVGGCVRDEIIGRPCNDIDYSIEAVSYDMMKTYISERYEIVYEQSHYYTIKAKDVHRNVYDFVLCRKDGEYSNHRHPTCVLQGTVLDDLKRRDFTMNSIAINMEDGSMIDPYNGTEDIKNRIIKCTGDIHKTLNEDVLRLIRAFRFHIVLDFKIDNDIVKYFWDINFIQKLQFVSKERIVSELTKCFTYNTRKTMKALSTFPVLSDYLFEHVIVVKLQTKI